MNSIQRHILPGKSSAPGQSNTTVSQADVGQEFTVPHPVLSTVFILEYYYGRCSMIPAVQGKPIVQKA